jgi:hypothetical protein
MKMQHAMGLAALGLAQVTAEIIQEPEQPVSTGPFTTTAIVTVRGGDKLWQCFDNGYPYGGGTCWEADRPPGIPECEIWQHTFVLTWCCVPCDWQNYGNDYYFHYSYWVGINGGQYWSIGTWVAAPWNNSGCPFPSPVFWDQTRIAGAVPTCPGRPPPTPRPTATPPPRP